MIAVTWGGIGMFFTRFGFLIAILATLVGFVALGACAFVIFSDWPREEIAPYLMGRTLIEAMAAGGFCVCFGVVLGVFAEISRGLNRGAGGKVRKTSKPREGWPHA